jgi:hypothetical protein
VATFTNNIYDSQTSGWATAGAGSGTGRTTAQMQDRNSFLSTIATSWDFTTKWRIPTGGGYPVLYWQEAISVPSVASLFAGGDGSNSTPYLIATASQWRNLNYAYQIDNAILTKEFQLSANIDMSGVTDYIFGDLTRKFSGHFHGANYQIQNLSISAATTSYVGLFGYLNGANVDNLTITGCTMTGDSYVGCLAGYVSTGTINNVTINPSHLCV